MMMMEPSCCSCGRGRRNGDPDNVTTDIQSASPDLARVYRNIALQPYSARSPVATLSLEPMSVPRTKLIPRCTIGGDPVSKEKRIIGQR